MTSHYFNSLDTINQPSIPSRSALDREAEKRGLSPVRRTHDDSFTQSFKPSPTMGEKLSNAFKREPKKLSGVVIPVNPRKRQLVQPLSKKSRDTILIQLFLFSTLEDTLDGVLLELSLEGKRITFYRNEKRLCAILVQQVSVIKVLF
jgi:hypothetical protein